MVRRQRSPSVAISTTLAANVTDSATTWTVTSASNMPSEGDFYLARGPEIVLVTARSTTTLTVIRGQCGTTAEAHNSGETVKSIMVAEEYTNRLKDYGRIQAAGYGRVLDINGAALPASSWTTFNVATGTTVTDGVDGTIFFTARTHTGNDLAGAAIAYSSGNGNKRYTAHFSSPTIKPLSGDHFGLFGRQSSGGAMYGITFYPGINVQVENRASYLVDPTVAISHGAPWRRDIWLRADHYWDNPVSDELHFDYSWDGVHWWSLYDYTGLAIGQTEWGLWVSNRTTVTYQAAYIESWIEEAL